MHTTKPKILALFSVALALLIGGTALAQDEKKVEVRIKTLQTAAECADGEGCEQRRVMFVGEDGEVTELHGDDHTWVSSDEDGEVHKRVMVIGGDHEGEHKVWVSEDGTDFDFQFGPDEMANAVFFGGPHGRGYLGVQLTELTPELRAHFGVPENEGVMVSKVVEDSPAWQAGVRVGDIIGQVDGSAISSGVALQKAIGGIEPGEVAALQVWRDGAIESINATIAENEGMQRRFVHKVVVCEDGEDCGDEAKVTLEVIGDHGDASFGSFDLDCGEDEDCTIDVNCSDDGSCTCVVDGQESDCESLPNVFVHRVHKDKE